MADDRQYLLAKQAQTVQKMQNRIHFIQMNRLKSHYRLSELNSNRKLSKTVLPMMVKWRKLRMARIHQIRMQRCIEQLNADICNNRGSFYQWGKMLAQRIFNGQK